MQQFGDIRNIYTACKHRGFVMISYYDIRSARNAMRTLQNKPLRRRKLDIHFSIPKVRCHPCFFCKHLIATSGKGDSDSSFSSIRMMLIIKYVRVIMSLHMHLCFLYRRVENQTDWLETANPNGFSPK